jgi:hypothetical protein
LIIINGNDTDAVQGFTSGLGDAQGSDGRALEGASVDPAAARFKLSNREED